jgi:hypothetical protein
MIPRQTSCTDQKFKQIRYLRHAYQKEWKKWQRKFSILPSPEKNLPLECFPKALQVQHYQSARVKIYVHY